MRTDEAALPRCAVIAPLLYLTVTVEREGDGERVHLHPGGQGFWIARMIEVLGCDAHLVSPIGGEAGEVVAALLPGWEIELTAVRASINSPTQIHDRRDGARDEIVAMTIPSLDRHAADDLYGAALESALACEAVVLTSGGDCLLPDDAYRRLVHDVGVAGRPVFADMHGAAMDAMLGAGPVAMLKVSEDDLAADGWTMGSERQAVDAARRLADRGATTVIVSRGAEPAIASIEGRITRIVPPSLAEADHAGAGDSMTAGVTVGSLLGLTPLDSVRLGAAAGAGNVTRRGLGSGHPDLISGLVELVAVEDVT